jgi:hypothetical protein
MLLKPLQISIRPEYFCIQGQARDLRISWRMSMEGLKEELCELSGSIRGFDSTQESPCAGMASTESIRL